MMFSQNFNSHRIFKRITKALIRLRVCAGWSEPLLVAHTTLLEISCLGSYKIKGLLVTERINESVNAKTVLFVRTCLVRRHFGKFQS